MISWICVDIHISERKLRRLRKILHCSNFEAKGMMVSLFQWAACNNVDDEGIMLDADETDIAEYLQKENTGGSLDGEEMVCALIEIGSIERIGGDVLRIHDWEENQKYMIKYNRKLRNDREKIAEKRKIAMEAAGAPQEKKSQAEVTGVIVPADALAAPTSPTELSQNKQEESKKKTGKNGIDYSMSFRQLWDIYPRKDDKARSYAEYKSRLKDGYTEEELYEATKSYVSHMKQLGRKREYILNGRNFFGADGRFTQYLPKPNETTQRGAFDMFRQLAYDPEEVGNG
ncbi:MAG: hypothetical protein LUD12_14045 [Lachnospiraceae bacterium]|nr:hypothetical protein [Lachnospiraceae bacterium]